LRMSADEYLALPADDARCELVDGVVIMSPRASFRHQNPAAWLLRKLGDSAESSGLEAVVPDIDVQVSERTVHRPGIVFVGGENLPRGDESTTRPPELVIEIASPSTRQYDQRTKKKDYERAGSRSTGSSTHRRTSSRSNATMGSATCGLRRSRRVSPARHCPGSCWIRRRCEPSCAGHDARSGSGGRLAPETGGLRSPLNKRPRLPASRNR
jgi:hypothetical protein